MITKALRTILIVNLLILALIAVAPQASAHGSMQNPLSRIYSCFLQNPESPDTLPCKDAIVMGGTQPLYDWNEVNFRDAGGNSRSIIPDGKLCSAGRDKYAAFDMPRLDWATTVLPASGNYTFVFTAAVPHNQGYFEFYATRNGWDPLQPLKWSDLDATPFLRFDNPPLANGLYSMTGALPSGKSGRHLIYMIWQRTDSLEAFYSCSDVWFGTSPTPVPTNPPVCTDPAWVSTIVYRGGASVSHNGKVWRAKWDNSSTEPSSDPNVNPWEIQGYCTPGSGTPPASSTPTLTPTRTATSSSTTLTPTRTNTPTGTTVTPTRTPTRTNTPTGTTVTPTRTSTVTSTPTQGSAGACSPVAATITAPFTFDGAGTLCWRSNNLGAYINSWNTASVTVNGVNSTNLYAFTSNLPAKMADGYWYISYTGNFPWSHFEAR